jgi:hypothetical protein
MILSIYAYYKLLVNRFDDYLNLHVRAALLFTIGPDVKRRLRRVPIDNPDIIGKYLASDRSIQHRRNRLENRKEALEKVYKILDADDTLFPETINDDSAAVEGDSMMNTHQY